MNKITVLEANTIMDIVADRMYHVLDYTDVCDYATEEMTDGIVTLTQDTFIKICQVLNIEKVEI